jgi:tetratricopeptide (TPR) repeat protein
MPLALAHARATCWTMGLGFDAYREKLPELIKRTPNGSRCPAYVFATVELASAQAFAQCRSAETLLGIAAYLAPERIPLDIVTSDVMSESERGKAVGALREVSLAEPQTLDDGTPAISVHRLVQEAIKARLRAKSSSTPGAQAANGEKAVIDVAMRLVAGAYPAGETGADKTKSWSRYKLLEPHVEAILAVAPEDGDIAQSTSHLLDRHGAHLQQRTDFAAAEPLYRRALLIDERLHGPEHPRITAQLGNLASLFLATDRLSEAEPLMRRALQINESNFGAEHPSVAISLGKLAHLLHRTNRLADAEPLMRRALAIDEKAHGTEHAAVASDLNDLARLLQGMGRFEEAEALFRRALAIDESVHAPNHPAVAIGLNNLAGLLQETDRFAEAEPLMRRAVSIFEASLGNDHPDTSISIYNLAELLRTTNRPAEAEPLLRRVLGIDEKIYGSDHLSVATDLTNLAHLLQNMSKAADAEPLMRRAMHILESSLGPDHPDAKAARADHASIMAVVQAIQDRLDADEAKRLGKYKAAHASPYPVTHIPVPEASADQRRPGLFSRLLGRR